MTQDTCSPGISGRALSGIDLGESLEPPAMRCADAARMRGEPLQASAVRYRRFLLLEAPGPWGASALDEKRMDARAIRQLSKAAADADAHVVLIRRPGRHPSGGSDTRPQAMAWAFADTSPEAERVLWGTWRNPADLLTLDPTADIPGEANAAGPQQLALVCTNGKRDQCCAIRGRPVAATVAAATDWDTWECSHLGGHRFAATMMLLPTGDMFGRLDPESALEVLQRFDAGQLLLSHYRGRAGQPLPAQAALHAAAVRLGDFRRGAIRVSSVRPAPAGLATGPAVRATGPAVRANGWPEHSADAADLWDVEVIHRTQHSPGTGYRIIMAGSRPAPAFLSCSDNNPKAEIRYETLSFSRVGNDFPSAVAGMVQDA